MIGWLNAISGTVSAHIVYFNSTSIILIVELRYLEDDLVHVVEVGEVGLRVFVGVEEVDGSGGGVTRLRDERADRPGELGQQIAPHDHVLNDARHGVYFFFSSSNNKMIF